MTVEINGDKKILSELGNKKRIDILKYLHQNGWCSSVKVAEAMGIHLAIVSRFLAICAEYGIAEKRFVRGKRRGFYEYRLRTPEFSVRVKVAEVTDEQRIKIVREMLAYCERVFGKAKAETIKSLLGKNAKNWIEKGDWKEASKSEIEFAEKQIFEALVKLAGIENAKKILENIKQEVKNE